MNLQPRTSVASFSLEEQRQSEREKKAVTKMLRNLNRNRRPMIVPGWLVLGFCSVAALGFCYLAVLLVDGVGELLQQLLGR